MATSVNEVKTGMPFNTRSKTAQVFADRKNRCRGCEFRYSENKNPEIKGAEYQQGVQSDFWNVREYVLYRDNHKCRYCKGKSKDMVISIQNVFTYIPEV